jgi:hypothetical protein
MFEEHAHPELNKRKGDYFSIKQRVLRSITMHVCGSIRRVLVVNYLSKSATVVAILILWA